jgi:hypothetical protein
MDLRGNREIHETFPVCILGTGFCYFPRSSRQNFCPIPMIVVFDTEDDSSELLEAGKSGFDKTVTQIAAICENGKRFHNRGNVKEFLKWCHEVNASTVWAFNTQYDLGDLCHEGKDLRLDDFDITMVKGRFIKGKVQGLKFCDVRNLCGGSVADLGLAVDLPKFGHPYTREQLLKFSPKRRAEFLEYLGMTFGQYECRCKAVNAGEIFYIIPDEVRKSHWSDKRYVFRDCEIPLAWLVFVKDMCEELGLESIPATLGTLCTKAFTAGGGQNWHETSEESASAIRGARVELFCGGGSGRIAYVDINSLYPWCMTQNFPECFETMQIKKTGSRFALGGYGICDCDVYVPKNSLIAPLPIRDEEGRLLFPVGNLSGVWTLAELRNAVQHGAVVKKIRSMLGSMTGKAYYRDYIVENYDRRLAAKSDAEKLFWKLLMNNLYGRLAISDEISRSMILTDENKDREDGIPYGKKILCTCKTPLPAFTNYLHAAHVLSYARVRLFSFLKRIEPSNLIYCDTDSIIFFCQGDLPFECSSQLGEMKLEKMGVRCEPYLPKVYTFTTMTNGTEYKAKGVPKKFAKSFIETKKAEYEMPFKLRESIKFYDEDNKRKLSVWRKVEKIMAAKYDKKRISGKFFLPKVVKMW